MREILREDWERVRRLFQRAGGPTAARSTADAAKSFARWVNQPGEDIPATEPVVIRHYRGSQASIRRQYEADASALLARGYRVESQEVIPGRRGCLGVGLGILTVGILFLFTRPKDMMVVTYRRD